MPKGIIGGQIKAPTKPPEANPRPPLPPKAAGAQAPVDVQRIEIAAKKLLAQPATAQSVVQMIKAAGDPASGLAQATITIMKQLSVMAKGQLPPKAIVPAAQFVLADIAKLGAAAKLYKLTPDLVKKAALLAIQMYTKSVSARKQQAQPQQPAQPQPQQPAPQPAAPPPAPVPAAAPAGV